ncbi:MAG: hypothetical protein N3C60_04800, partial [Calditerrivibrio sp.]|nr:hypothetical protein [Calditerrivibrio sp.]
MQLRQKLIIIILLILINNLLTAAENPEIIVQIGHSSSIKAITSDGYKIASVSSDDWKGKGNIQIKIWDISTGRLQKEINIIEETNFDNIAIFFLKDQNELLLLGDKRKIGISFLTIDIESGSVVRKLQMPYEDFLKKLEEIIRVKYIKESSLPIESVFYLTSEKIKMVRDFGLVMILHEKLIEDFLVSMGHKLFAVDYLKSEYRFGDIVVSKMESKNLKIKTSSGLVELSPISVFPLPIITFDKRYLIAVSGDSDRLYRQKIVCYEVVANEKKEFGDSAIRQEWLLKGDFDKYLVSYDYFDNTSFSVWDIENASYVSSGKANEILKYLKFGEKDDKGNFILTQKIVKSKNQKFSARVLPLHIALYNEKDKKEIAKFILFRDFEWIVITPEGYYNASPNGEKYLNVRVGNNVYSIENYREAFYRPDLVKLALSGHSLKDYKTIADVKQPPLVEIIDTPKEVSSDEVKVTLRLIDTGGGIGDIRLYLNESAILLD